MAFFKKRISLLDAYQAAETFVSNNGAQTLTFVVSNTRPTFIQYEARFEVRKDRFVRNWTFGAFCVATAFNEKAIQDLCMLGRLRSGYPSDDKQVIEAFMRTHNLLDDSSAALRYELIRLLFSVSFNDPRQDKFDTINVGEITVEGKVHAELLACARYILFLGNEFEIERPPERWTELKLRL